MKQKILIAVCLLFSVTVNAQFSSLTTNLILNARPSARLSEWANNRATLTLIVTNQQSPKRGKIKVTVKAADGTEVSTTDLARAITQIFPDGQTVLNAAVVYPLEIQKFSGKYQSSLNKTGKLPSDSYQFCVDIIEEGSVVPLTTQKCASFFVAGLQLPICMMPADNQVLDYAKASTAIIFRWTPIIPRPSTAVIYKLQIFEVLENQQPMQALRSNQPILDKDIIGQTQFIWQPQGIINCCGGGGFETDNQTDFKTTSPKDTATIKNPSTQTVGNSKQYIWTIQSLDAKGDAIAVDANYEGRSEPKQFSVANKTQDKARKTAKQGHVTLLK
jgi:hypothetical protein